MNKVEGHQANIRSFPTWHYPMLNDHFRNGVIEAAIRDANIQEKTIIEIGTGAGLTAILFAKYGAKEVITCELNPQMYEIAQKTISKSEYKSTIKLLNKSSTEAIKNNDFKITPDIIFTETLDCGIIGEGFYSIAQDIQKIKGPNTEILPGLIDQFGVLINSDSMHELNYVENTLDIDFAYLNTFKTSTYYPVKAKQHNYKPISELIKTRTYSYNDSTQKETLIKIKAHASNICHGILSYFTAHYGNYKIGNNPIIPSHWHQAFHPLENPVKMIAGESYQFTLTPNGALIFLGIIK